MILNKLTITGLGNQFDYNLDFSEKRFPNRVCIITGPNGYGKSLILDIISRMVSGDLLDLATSVSSMGYMISKNIIFRSLTAEFGIPDAPLLEYEYDPVKEQASGDYKEKLSDRISVSGPEQHIAVQMPVTLGFSQEILDKFNKWFRRFEMPSFSFFHDDISNMIYLIRNGDPNYFEHRSISKCTSSGERQILYLMTQMLRICLSPANIPHLLLIDEVEQHLHLAIQTLFYKFFTDMMPENCQIIMTTHSPSVIGCVWNRAVDLYENSIGEDAFNNDDDNDE